MIILAFDTCLDKTYAVLKKDDVVFASEVIENTDTKYHSAFLISTLQKIVKSNNIKPKDIDLIAVNIGPGSFTGIRACITVARVMGQQLKCKVIGISSLEILANAVLKQDRAVLVALDARKNKAYLWHDNEIKGAVEIEKVKEIIKSGQYEVITDDKLQPILGGKSYQQEHYPIGEILAELAFEKIKYSNGDWKNVLPLYIQPPPAGN